jgi:predicted DNA-binding transcriptional regulator AlpA
MQHDTSKREPTDVPSNVADPVYVDDRELAHRTSIARATWQKMRFEGRGPAVRKIGRRCLYRWSEVVAWLEAHRIGGDASGGVGP